MRYIRIGFAVAALIVGAVFLQRAFWYHRHFDAIIRIPFVFGSLIIGLIIAAVGIRLLLVKTD